MPQWLKKKRGTVCNILQLYSLKYLVRCLPRLPYEIWNFRSYVEIICTQKLQIICFQYLADCDVKVYIDYFHILHFEKSYQKLFIKISKRYQYPCQCINLISKVYERLINYSKHHTFFFSRKTAEFSCIFKMAHYADVLRSAVSKCKAADLESLLRQWGYLTVNELNQLDFSKSKACVVREVAKLCEVSDTPNFYQIYPHNKITILSVALKAKFLISLCV